ncbi:MAG: hypothetical protein QOF24_1572 [Verrucomicrobiota bacterium]|jgi:hypothetical protein
MNDATRVKASRQPRLPEVLLGAVVGSLVLGAAWAVSQLGRPVFDAVAASATPRSLLLLAVILAIALLFSLGWAFALYRALRSPASSHFDFDEYGGFYIDRKSGLGVCARCLSLEEPRVVHLMDVNGNKMCNACGHSYRGKSRDPAKA